MINLNLTIFFRCFILYKTKYGDFVVCDTDEIRLNSIDDDIALDVKEHNIMDNNTK